MRSYHVAIHNLTQEGIKDADIVIAPNLRGIPLMSGKENEKMYKIGITATNEALDEIKKQLNKRGVKLLKNN
jgi:fructose-specific phosphotransferase system component IIB